MVTFRNLDRNLSTEKLLSAILYFLGVLLVLYTLYYAFTLQQTRKEFANIFLGISLVIFYLTKIVESDNRPGVELSSQASSTIHASSIESVITKLSLSQRISDNISILYGVFALISIVCSFYIAIEFARLRDLAYIHGFSLFDYIIGILLIIVVTDATKRAYGWGVTSVVLMSLGYAFAGPQLPGVFAHSGFSVKQVIEMSSIGLNGVYSFILEVGVTWVAVFIFFAGMARAYGLLDYIMDLGIAFSSRFKTGIVHVAVVSSLALGSITGSAAANTATTGSFTIPMMKEQGVRDDYAAAIESVASSGGQMMPPVMGVAAFLMADILNVPYVRVIQAGLFPALLFYLSVAISIHFLTLKFGWTVEKQRKSVGSQKILEGLHFVVPISALLYFLIAMRLTPLSAGTYTILILVATTLVRGQYFNGIGVDSFLDTLKKTIEGLKQGAQDMAPLAAVLASMGIIVDIVTQTGLSQKLSARMVVIAAGVFIVLLILTMITSILFGLGVPTPAAYILVVILVAPSLINFGVRELTAHMFVFYFAMLSAITPPVAISVAIGSQIAHSSFLTTCKQALRIGAPGFLIPFVFIANDDLIYWSAVDTAITLTVVFIGLISITVGMTGYNGRTNIKYILRMMYIAIAAFALFGPRTVQIIASLFIILMLIYSSTLKPLVKTYVFSPN
jgi:TRAP transporter 4TM/12TM fusion protein